MVKIIKNKTEHGKAMNRIAELMSTDPSPGSAAGAELELLAHLVQDYETKNHDIGLPTPLEAIRFRMDQQNLRPKDLVPYFGSSSRVSEVLNGKRQLTMEMVRKLNKGLGIPAEVLVQETKVNDDANDKLSAAVTKLRSDVFKEMVRRKWFVKFRGSLTEAKQNAVSLWQDFLCFGTDSDALLAFNRQSVRGKRATSELALLAWKTQVLRVASKKRLPTKFDVADVTDTFLQAIVSLSRIKDGPRLAVGELEKIGIAIVIEPHLPTTHLDGAAMKLPNGRPVIGLTLRHDRLDNFFFCLFHELGHIVRHIETGKAELFLDDLETRSTEKLEQEADAFAVEYLIPRVEWERFWEAGDFEPKSVRRAAKRLGIHGAIVAGRIRKEKNDFQILSRLVHEAKVRHAFDNPT